MVFSFCECTDFEIVPHAHTVCDLSPICVATFEGEGRRYFPGQYVWRGRLLYNKSESIPEWDIRQGGIIENHFWRSSWGEFTMAFTQSDGWEWFSTNSTYILLFYYNQCDTSILQEGTFFFRILKPLFHSKRTDSFAMKLVCVCLAVWPISSVQDCLFVLWKTTSLSNVSVCSDRTFSGQKYLQQTFWEDMLGFLQGHPLPQCKHNATKGLSGETVWQVFFQGEKKRWPKGVTRERGAQLTSPRHAIIVSNLLLYEESFSISHDGVKFP